jgi:hypothetical protein
LHVHTLCGEKTPCMSILLVVDWDTPCMSIYDWWRC